MTFQTPFTLVLSGGGLKGLAHIGVLRALEERGLTPGLVVGSSMGSLVAASWAAGMPIAEMTERALEVRRKDIFQVAHVDMALKRMRAPAIYRREPLDALIHTLVGDRTFEDLVRPLVINTVELNTGMQVMWGLPGLRSARVADAVFASCALPGIFPPREIEGRWFVDGAVIENVPVQVAASHGAGPVMAVDVGATSSLRSNVQDEGFAATYIRGLEIVMQTMMESRLRQWTAPPLVLVAPAGGACVDVRVRAHPRADRGGPPRDPRSARSARRQVRSRGPWHPSAAAGRDPGGPGPVRGVRRLRHARPMGLRGG